MSSETPTKKKNALQGNVLQKYHNYNSKNAPFPSKFHINLTA